MAGGKFSEARLHAMTIRESENDGSDFSNPTTDYRVLFLGEDGALHVKDSAGTVTDIGGLADQGVVTYFDFTEASAPGTPASGKVRLYALTDGTIASKDDAGTETVHGAGGGGGGIVDQDSSSKSDSNVTLNSTSWADVATGTDLSVAASEGDILLIGADAVTGSQNVGVGFNFEMVTSGNLAHPAPRGFYNVSGDDGLGRTFSKPYTVVSGDISTGDVAIRLQYLTNTASNKTLYATGNYTLEFWVINLGQP